MAPMALWPLRTLTDPYGPPMAPYGHYGPYGPLRTAWDRHAVAKNVLRGCSPVKARARTPNRPIDASIPEIGRGIIRTFHTRSARMFRRGILSRAPFREAPRAKPAGRHSKSGSRLGDPVRTRIAPEG